MDPEFARDLRERMAASLGSLNRVVLELLAKRPSILFSHDTSWADIRRHSECVRETGTGSEDRWECMFVEEFVAESTVEALDTAVLRRLSRIDKVHPDRSADRRDQSRRRRDR